MSRVFLFLWLMIMSSHGVSEEHAYPDFAPDGSAIVFSADWNGNHDLYVADVESGTVRVLVESSSTQSQPTWSPDGKYVAYIDRNWNPASNSKLKITSVSGGESWSIDNLGDVFLPHWADDGLIYFSMRVKGSSDIFSVRPDGTELKNLTNTADRDEANVDVFRHRMIYDVPDGESHAIEVLDLRTGHKTLVLTGGIFWDPTWMPNGNIITGVYPNADSTLSLLTEFDSKGRKVRQWTPDSSNVFWPAISPARDRVIFSLSDKGFTAGVLYETEFCSDCCRDRSSQCEMHRVPVDKMQVVGIGNGAK